MIELTLIAGLVGFYIINLALGLYQGRHVRTAFTYVFGHRYSTGVLLLTLTGTFIGAKYVTHQFRTGAFYGGASLILFVASVCLGSLFVAYYLFPKLRSFKEWYTLGDIVRQAYGSRYAQLAVEFVSLFSSIILLVAQIVALNRLSPLLGIGKDATLAPYLLVISFTVVVIIYASRSGAPGVVTTDVLQMILVFGVISFIVYNVLNLNLDHVHIQGVSDLWRQVKLQYGNNPFTFFPHAPGFKRILVSHIFPTVTLLLFSPACIKRIGMARDNRQLKHSLIGFITIFSLFMLMMLIAGWGLYIVNGGVIAYDEVHTVLLKIIPNQLWMKLLLLMMVVAAVMSTADSILTAASVCAVRFITSFKHYKGQPSAPSLGKLRVANVVIGLLALVLALLFMHRPIIDFVTFATALLGGLVPCVIGISLGIKRSGKALLGSMVCFGLLFIGCIILVQVADFSFLDSRMTSPAFPLRLKYKALLPFVILLSVLMYVVFEVIIHKGLKWQARERFTEVKPSMLKRAWLEVKKLLSSPVLWSEEKVDAYESRGVLLTLLCVVAFLTSQFAGMPLHPSYLKPMTMLMLLVFSLCTFNLFPEEWYQKLRRYYALYWLMSLVVCLPFAFLLRWLYHPTSLNTLYLIFVPFVMQFFIGGHLSVTLALLGYVIGFGVYRLTADAGVVLDHTMLPLIAVLCTTLLTWIGGGYHMQRKLKQASRPKLWAASWGHDLNHLFMEAQMEISLKYRSLPKEEKAQFKEAKKRLQLASQYLEHGSSQARIFRDLIVRNSIRASEIETLPLTEVVNYVYGGLTTVLQEIVSITGKAPIKVKVCAPIFANVITNLIRNARDAGATKVELAWDEKEPILYISNNGPGIPKDRLATLFEESSNRDGTGLGLPFIKEVLAKMSALIDVRSSDGGTEFMILFDQESRG